MTFRLTSAVFCVICLCASPLAWADDFGQLNAPAAASPDATPWAAAASLGYTATHGNTNSKNLNFKGAIGRHVGKWTDVLRGQANYAKSDQETSAQSWEVGNMLRYSFTENNYWFGMLHYIQDRFAGIPERATEAAGYGRRVLSTKTQQLNLGVGVGASQQREADSRKMVTKPLGLLLGDYVWKISDNAQFSQALRVEWTPINMYINPVTQLKLTIVGNLFATLDYEVRYNTRVPADTVHTDTITSVNIGYGFGKF